MDQLYTEQDSITVRIPGSKSLTHRYLIGAALAQGVSTLYNCQDSRDIHVTKRLLGQLGAVFTENADGSVSVTGINGKIQGGSGTALECNVGESGTSCRLLSAIFAAGDGLFKIFGEGRMHKRPIEDLCKALTRLGAGIIYTEESGYPPFLLQARGLNPDLVKGELSIGMDASSQYFSGLLLAAPLCPSKLVLELGGHKAVSWPYVGLTLQTLSDFGVPFTVETRPKENAPWFTLSQTDWRNSVLVQPGCLRITVTPHPYVSGTFHIEGDWSNASYFLAAGALGKRPVCVEGLNEASLQGDRLFLDILSKMGCHIESTDHSVTVFPSKLHGVDLDMGFCPDLVQTVSLLAAFANGSTRIRNVKHLRFKETDRLKAPYEELTKIGITVDTLSDGLLINGCGGQTQKKRGQTQIPNFDVQLATHNDHRMAMSLALLDCINPDFCVHDHLDTPDVVTKSFPTFWEKWQCIRDK